MLKWFSGEEGAPGSGGAGSPLRVSGGVGEVAAEEMAERLSHTEQLVSQLKEMIREKDTALRAKDDQLKAEKDASEAKLSKLRLQNKAKVTSLTSQLEELKKQNRGVDSPSHSKKGGSESGDHANRGKIVLLKKKVEELEQQLTQRDLELSAKKKELESQRLRGDEMDAMLIEKDRKLAEKEAYIVHLQTATAGDQPVPQPMLEEGSGALQDLQLLVQNLTKKIGEAEERYSLLQEQTESIKDLLTSEKEQYSQKENMYKQNIQTFKDIILQKDNQLSELNQMHEQELFKLAAKSDASADLEQLLKALKQKLHEKEEVLLGRTQVIDVLQGEVDARDEQIKELTERLKRLQVEQKNLESKMEAEKHVMRAQIRDLMEKHQSEVQKLTEQHQTQLSQTQQAVMIQLEEQRREQAPGTTTEGHTETASAQRMAQLEAKAKEKTEEASKSEAKFLKMKAWSKSRIRQLEDELKKSQAGAAPPDLTALRSHITALEEERQEHLWKEEQYEELRAKNEMLEAKLVVYEEQQRTLQADLEQFTKRATSQASESGSADDTQSQVLEWQEMVAEAVSARDRAREEKTTMALRISHLEEEKEALATRQQELEEELAQSRGLSPHRSKKLARPAQRSLQEDFEFDGHVPFQEPRSPSEITTPMEGENMGDGLRSVVEELELERNQLQEQILSLEERCQDLEDRLQLQARIETLQNETEKLQSQLASVRSQQSREAEKHQLLVNSLNEQLRGLSDTQECLESSLIEKENTLAQTSEKLELISSLREALREKEVQYKEVSDKLLQTEHSLEEVTKKCSNSEKQCHELKMEVADLTQKLNMVKEKAQKQEATIETLQTELDQTNEDLDKLNTAHLEERAQLIHDLQSCEREIDNLKDTLCEKEKEILTLTSNMTEYTEQITELKQEIKLKEDNLVQVESALSKAERETMVLRDSQSSDHHVLNGKISELVETLSDFEMKLTKTKEERDSKGVEVEQLIERADEDKKTIQELRSDVQKQAVTHRNHLSECETHIHSLKEQLSSSNNQLKESEDVISQLNANNGKMLVELQQKEGMFQNELKSIKEEQNRLLAEVETYKSEIQTLNKRLEEQGQNEESIRLELQGKLNIIMTLEMQIEEEKTKYNSDVQSRDSENQKISSELQSKTENLSKLKNTFKNLKIENGQLQKKLKSLTDELGVEKGKVKKLDGKMASVTEIRNGLEKQTQCLAEEKAKLEQIITQHASSISELTAEKDELNAKVTQLNAMYSESVATIEGLQKEKEELTIRTNDLNKVLEQSTHSNSEILLTKTNECSHLSQLLREKEEESTRLREKVENLSSKVARLERDLVEKDNSVSELRSSLVDLQNRGKHHEEALAQLEERERSLKSEAVQKDGLLEEKQTMCSKISRQLEDKEEYLQNITKEYEQQKEEINNLVMSLQAQLSSTEEKVRSLQSEMESRQSEIVQLQSAFQSAMEENRNVHNNVESKDKELARLDEQLKNATEQVSSLSDQNKTLLEELEHNTKAISELSTERRLLQDRISNMEEEKMNDQKVIDGLTKEKEDITVTITKLNKALRENEILNSEKTNECSVLLREKEECVQSLQGHVDKLKIEIGQLNVALNEKDHALLEQKNQHLQLEDTISMLQEQGSVLKSALMERDTMVNQKIQEADQIKEIMSTMQAEMESLSKNSMRMKGDLEQKDQTLQALTLELQSHKDELCKRNESVMSLSSQLGAMNESAAEMESELTNWKATVEKLTSEKAHLVQEGEQNKTKIIDFENSFQLLNEQKGSLKIELFKMVTELSKTKEEMESYKAQVCDGENRISALFNELKVEKETLNLTMQGNDDVLKRQQDLVQQLNERSTEQEHKLKEKINENVNLVENISELQNTVAALRGQVDGLTSESLQLKTTLENKEKANLEYKNSSSAAVKKFNLKLKAKEKECESLKEKISHLGESSSKLNSSLQVQITETENLQRILTEKEALVSEQSRRIEDLQRKADEALLFKTQFTESTEFVSRLQSECENLQKSAEETQSAFTNLQEKYAAQLEDFHNVQTQLSQKADEVANLSKLLQDRTSEHQNAQSTIETLSRELFNVRDHLEKAQEVHSTLTKEKDEALASHQSNVSLLTVEIERLKSQHRQVVTQMDALTENIEQREMALHAINRQYTAQAQHTSQLVSRIQTLEDQNMGLQTEMSSSKEENLKQITAVGNENAHLQEKIRKLVEEKSNLEKAQHQFEQGQVELKVQMEQQSNSSSQTLERLASEKESLQAKVSAKDEDISKLKEKIEKLEQILQDSEKEWLSVLDKEKQDRNLITEQLKCVENEIRCKDVKVSALKEDLDHLQEKLSEAVLAVKQGSEQLMAKEIEASTSKGQLENLLASLQEKNNVNNSLQQILNAVEIELLKLVDRNHGTDKHTYEDSNEKSAYLLDMIKDLQQSHRRELDVLKSNLNETVAKLNETENLVNDGQKADNEKGQHISILEESVNHLQTQLQEAEAKGTSLYRDMQAKEEYISCMNVQITQQKELLTGLSQQLKEKDASIAQVMESAANERVRLTEESSSLKEQLEVVENEHKTLMESSQHSSQQLESDMSKLKSDFDTKNLEMSKKNDELKSDLAKLAKQKEVMKKNLQAALVVRKDLMKKIETFESQHEENANVRSQVSLLNDKLQEVENRARAAEELCQEKVAALEQKEAELVQMKSESETENHKLKASLSEKETCLVDSLQKLEQLEANLSEKENNFDKDKCNLMLRIEELQKEVKTCRDESALTSAAAASELDGELAQLKRDKAMLQKKAQAALLARKETTKKAQEIEKKLTQELAELKDDYKALLEQQCQQTNELNAVQFSFDEKAKELEELCKMSTSYLDELNTLRELLEEKENSLQDLKMVVAEKESHCHVLSNELETVKSKIEDTSLEGARKDEVMKLKVEELESKLQIKENELIKAQNEVEVQRRGAQKYLDNIKVLELQCEQEKQLSESESIHKYQIITEENKDLLDKCNQTNVELEAALQLVSEKSSETLMLQKCLEETQQRLSEDKEDISTKLHQVHQDLAEMHSNLEFEKQEKINAQGLIDKLRYEITLLSEQLNESQNQNTLLQEQTTELAKLPEMDIQGLLLSKSSEVSGLRTCFEETQQRLDEDKEKIAGKLVELHQDLAQMQSNLELEKQEKANAFVLVDTLKDEVTLIREQLHESENQYVHLQEQLSEKQALIGALEHQLEQQTKQHCVAIEKMKTETTAIQTSSEEPSKQDEREIKMALLTKKLQAALVSRKELQKNNGTLNEELEKLSAKYVAKEAEFSVAQSSILNLRKQNSDLESSVVTLGNERDDLKAEVNSVLNDNGSLSAACESLKQTIENITQQKQAFSCQLESLKDSQTEELSQWKSKHSELKHEYESLLQAYENVSSEMDKMRQLLEAAKKDRQEAIWKVHKHETELENLQTQIKEMEIETEKLKENVQTLSQDKDLRVEELEADSTKTGHLEAEVVRLAETAEDLRKQLSSMEAEKENIVEALKDATCTMQGKLDEALCLNNSLTVQIEAQKTELSAQLEINQLLQKEKQSLTEEIDKIQNEHELQLGKKDEDVRALGDILTQHSQETISLNEKVRILEDDKSLLQEELENTQEISDKVKNENEYLETVILKNSEKIDELTESINTLQSQNVQLSSQLTTSQEMSNQIVQEKEEEQLKLVKELEEKLKTVQRGNEGSKNVKKELRELLKEKHQEINLLQQNCITYQEVILDLESSLKISQSTCGSSEKELDQCIEKMSVLEERSKQLENEIITSKGVLDEANKRALSIQAERDQLALDLSQRSLKAEETYSFVENQVLQQQIEDLKMISNAESQKVMELQQQIDSQSLQLTTLKRAAEMNEAKLTALTSSPQGADATKMWNDLYQKALHEKDNQLLEQGFVIKRFLEDMRIKEKEVNDLRVAKSRLERTLNEYSVAAAAHQRQLFVMSASNAELNEILEVLSGQVKELTAQVERVEKDKNALNRQLVDKEDTLSQVQLKLLQVEKLYADSEVQMHQLQTQNDKFQAEYEKQEGISLQLKTILQSKNAEISSLLSCKDGQKSGYLEQLQANYRSQISVYEDRLTSARYQREKSTKELRSLEAKVKSLQIQVNKAVQEKDHTVTKMESFKNSLVSLQSERERIMSEYRILEAKNQLELKSKEGSVEGEGGATKGLKHEIRKLLHQMDDLNSENAMLRAQLVRYREDLNQVLSLKDNQLKVLLKKQQDTIKVLENDKLSAEKQHREIRLDLQKEEEMSSTLKSEISKLQTQITKLERDKNEMVTTNELRVISDLQNAIASKAAECNDLQQKLLFEKNQSNEFKNQMQQLENETDKKLSEAEEKYNSELDNFEREVNLMRNEREIADQRVAELAKDLLELEQQLSEAKTQSKDAKTQNESLCKAMAALQNDRDQLIEDFKILRNRYDEELRETQAALTNMERKFQDATSDLTVFGKERDVVVHKLKALQSKDTQSELTKLVDELGKALSEKEGELKHVKMENETYSRQMSAFSRSMASLQNDRDRLMDELGAKREFEHKQGSSQEVVTSGSVDKSKHGALQLTNEELDVKQKLNDAETEVASSQDETAALRSSQDKRDMQPPTSGLEETVTQLEQERLRLHQDLQRCLFEIQRRDQYLQQLNTKLQQTVEEKGSVSAQLRSVSQTLHDTQDRCHWLEGQAQAQQGSVYEVAPGAPQERGSDSVNVDLTEVSQHRERLLELEQCFAEERARRETAEEALRVTEEALKVTEEALKVTEDRVKSEHQRDFTIEMEPDDEWEAHSLDPNQPLITRKVRGGMWACRRWLRGRSLYVSRLLTARARSRNFFLAYLLTLHVLVLMCLTGAL